MGERLKDLEAKVMSLEAKIDSLSNYIVQQNNKIDALRTLIEQCLQRETDAPKAFQKNVVVGSKQYRDDYLETLPTNNLVPDTPKMTHESSSAAVNFEISQTREHDIEEIIWKNALESNTVQHYQDYLDKFPNGKYAEDAQKRKMLFETNELTREPSMMEKLDEAFWRLSYAKDTIEAYEEYLEEYPQGQYNQKASERIAQLKAQL